MFSFFKKKEKIKEVATCQLSVDIHSHLIPGIDDGSKSLEESMLLLRMLAELGYKKVITTPHIMSDYYKNDYETIMKGRDLLRDTVKKEGIKIEIDAAAEYYLDEKFYDEMKKENILSINGKYVLFETSYMSKPLQLEEMIFAIGEAGFTPLLAHPERYRYIKEPEKEYGRLKELGVMFQLNLNSLGGHYGKQAKALATYLVEAGLVDFIGSDTHHKKHLESFARLLSSKECHQLLQYNTILNDTLME